MMNYDIKVNPRKKPHTIVTDSKPVDTNDAKLELTAACAEYVNAVAPGKRYDVKDLGNSVADFINKKLCLNPDTTPNCVKVAHTWQDIWDELDKAFDDVANDNKWHNVKHIDEPGLKIDKWVKKNIG